MIARAPRDRNKSMNERVRRYAKGAAFALYAQARVQAALRARQRTTFVRRP